MDKQIRYHIREKLHGSIKNVIRRQRASTHMNHSHLEGKGPGPEAAKCRFKCIFRPGANPIQRAIDPGSQIQDWLLSVVHHVADEGPAKIPQSPRTGSSGSQDWLQGQPGGGRPQATKIYSWTKAQKNISPTKNVPRG